MKINDIFCKYIQVAPRHKMKSFGYQEKETNKYLLYVLIINIHLQPPTQII